MKTLVVVAGIVVSYAVLGAPAPVAGQGGAPAKRVEPFTHLTAPRVERIRARGFGMERLRLDAPPSSGRASHEPIPE